VIHLIAKYENNLQDALIENVMTEGDSAGRGLLVGMILGAHPPWHGRDPSRMADGPEGLLRSHGAPGQDGLKEKYTWNQRRINTLVELH